MMPERLLLCATLLAAADIRAGALVLVQSGSPTSTMVVPDRPNRTVKLAAEELQYHLAKMSGANLKIVPEKRASRIPATHVRVCVGSGRTTAGLGLSASELPVEHYLIETRGNVLVLLGHDDSMGHSLREAAPLSFGVRPGTLFAVYHLLDEHLGVRWLWPGEVGEHIPRRKTVTIGEVRYRGGPKLMQRHLRQARSSRWFREEALKEDSTKLVTAEVRAELNRKESLWLRRHRMGSHADFHFGHAFTHWWRRYGWYHPEYFAVLPEGAKMRDPEDVKLCVSNPVVRRRIVADWIRVGKPGYINCCPNDSLGFCVCRRCRAWDYPPGGNDAQVSAGSRPLSDRYVRFWNAIADEARAVDPDATITGYAYSGYQAPPQTVKLRPNMFVGYACGSLGSWHYERWRRWREAGANLFLRPNWWHVGYLGPHLPLREAGTFLKFAFENGLCGTDFDSLLGHWGTQGPYYYLIARLHTRPALTVDEIIREYAQGFGPAQSDIVEYLNYWDRFAVESYGRLKELRRKYGVRRGLSRPYYALLPLLYDEEAISKAEAILKRATGAIPAVQEYDSCRRRVQFLVDGMTYVRLANAAILANRPKLQKLRQATALESIEAARALHRFRREHMTDFVEWGEGTNHIEIHRAGNDTGILRAHEMGFVNWFDDPKSYDKVVGRNMDLSLATYLGNRRPVAALPLRWYFAFDPQKTGERKGWYRHDFRLRDAGSAWETTRIDRHWEREEAGVRWKTENGRDYDGWGWYRTELEVSPQLKGQKLTLLFGAIAGDAQVWVNGEPVGQHRGRTAEDRETPFEIDISQAARFGPRANTIVVLVKNASGHGGIWKRVWLMAVDEDELVLPDME